MQLAWGLTGSSCLRSAAAELAAEAEWLAEEVVGLSPAVVSSCRFFSMAWFNSFQKLNSWKLHSAGGRTGFVFCDIVSGKSVVDDLVDNWNGNNSFQRTYCQEYFLNVSITVDKSRRVILNYAYLMKVKIKGTRIWCMKTSALFSSE